MHSKTTIFLTGLQEITMTCNRLFGPHWNHTPLIRPNVIRTGQAILPQLDIRFGPRYKIYI